MQKLLELLRMRASKQEKSYGMNAAGGEAFLDAGLTDMEAGPETPASKPSAKMRRNEFLKNKGQPPYELASIYGSK
ncbi:MAG: hypothetical protein K0S29_702 [Gammaproteobacteria bacterium]|jgi:hypothetical protein|nr:hypothetical protein [Gammaproteobacteria bacterium]